MASRRLEDRASALLAGDAPEPGRLRAIAPDGAVIADCGQLEAHWTTRSGQPPLFLVRAAGGDLLCLTGAEVWLGSSAAPITDESPGPAAEQVRQRYAAVLQKHRFHEGFVVYVELLNSAESAREVQAAVLEHAPRLLGAYAAVLLLADDDAAGLEPVGDARLPMGLGSVAATELQARSVPTVLTFADTLAGRPFAGLAALFTELHATELLCTGLGDLGLLLLVERRTGREFSGEEWFRFQVVAHHTQRALERLGGRPHLSTRTVQVN